ncbi:hypothetical protein [Kitasatospora sp. NPDC085879]|uniref:hypothetical protein n=1 Tax=Kitasatospora sp. NPDC085879 TaxID=3154769 RepID=UPI003440940A
MNPNLKIFITIFRYISAVAGRVTAVMHASHKPTRTTAPSSPACSGWPSCSAASP